LALTTAALLVTDPALPRILEAIPVLPARFVVFEKELNLLDYRYGRHPSPHYGQR
jgi:hypothetical protein